MRLHSYVGLAFAYLGMAVKQERLWDSAGAMAEEAHDFRVAKCMAQLERDGRFGECSCGEHTLVERGDGNGEVFLWR
jgi:hypothetical protein